MKHTTLRTARSATAVMNEEFAGCSMSELRARLAHWEDVLRRIDDGDVVGGWWPREHPLERIADISREIAGREAAPEGQT